MGWPLKTDSACQDRLGYAVWIAGNVRVPEPDYRPAEIFQPPGPRRITKRVDMLAPVELDGQPHLPTRQIDDEPFHHQLPREPRAEMRDLVPDRDLRIGRMIAQFPSTPRHLGRDTGHLSRLRSRDAEGNPPPAPPFQGGGKSADQFISSSVHQFHCHRGRFATADAERGEAALLAGCFECREQRCQDPRTARADRVA